MGPNWGQGIYVHLNCAQTAALISADCSSSNPESRSVGLPVTASVCIEKSLNYIDCLNWTFENNLWSVLDFELIYGYYTGCIFYQ